ncbi:MULTISPECIES: response regulator transcription factor [Geomicrobium]|uniref:DNA-binding NarL/FixJ family response regulator n=1 Tax=Geomicrobium sediminis TaxID=1347788 RepID=A0ABS2P826_9BACL|nr:MULTISPECIES: LuxR C-terminal-related transcriptional regulator [Geomicrobium]MBM7631276.1 DNA-binding NarL/FixJ family response regulator [Geomicrobium sediminis]GAK07222.1 transcriptional regulator DegU, LuxR family [Geomicrobium sp. JCM 19038]
MHTSAQLHFGNKTGKTLPFLWLQLGGKRNDEFLLTALKASGFKTKYLEQIPDTVDDVVNDVSLLSKEESFYLLESGRLYGLMNRFRICAAIPADTPDLLKKTVESDITTLICINQSSRSIAQHFATAIDYSSYVDPLLQTELIEVLRLNRSSVINEPPFEIVKRNMDPDALMLDHAKASIRLTASECRVLDSILKGKSNRKIAEDDFLSVSTVNNHVSQLTKKINANDRTHAIKRVIQLGWLRSG